jgi:hypothetical protein
VRRLAQDVQRLLAVAWRPEHTGARQLHGTEAHAVDAAAGQRVRVVIHAAIMPCRDCFSVPAGH